MNVVEKNIKKVQKLCKKHDVKELYLFGSALSKKFTLKSDIDFLVKFDAIPLLKYADNYFDLKHELEMLFNRQVDLLEIQTLKNPYLIDSINENKILIYGQGNKKMAA